jgi:squalene-hopene/tetraprenyl-beta-curcumene cyclase
MKTKTSFRNLAILLTTSLSLFTQNAHASLNATVLDAHVKTGMAALGAAQTDDGSFTRLILSSSSMYNMNMIMLYEFLNRTEEKKDTIAKLMNFAWEQQNPDGGINNFPGGTSNAGMSLLVYVGGKIAGLSEDSPHMLALEKYIRDSKATDHPGVALPYLMLFRLNTDYACANGATEDLVMKMEADLPWIKVILFPLMHVLSTGQTHELSADKFPSRLKIAGFCPTRLPHVLTHLESAMNVRPGDAAFWSWMDAHMNTDGTLFDYTPSTVPALMALATGGEKYKDLLETGLKTLESFQMIVPSGLYESAGEASIGETDATLMALLEMGATDENPIVQKAEHFLLAHQQAETGAFGFSKHNQHFPDTDDTGNTVYVLEKIAKLRGKGMVDPETKLTLEKAIDWLVSVQNKDGGFGTWDKDVISLLDVAANRTGIVLSESIPEHTSRILMMFSEVRDWKPEYQASYARAVDFLLNRQLRDGSYEGTWFVDYLFGTAMAMNALGHAPDSPAIEHAINIGVQFVLAHQALDGGFSESPESFVDKKTIPLIASSPAQTGLILNQLMGMLESSNGKKYSRELEPAIERAVNFLLTTQQADGMWHDGTWTAVTFPKLEYLIYPTVQEVEPLGALGLSRVLFAQ